MPVEVLGGAVVVHGGSGVGVAVGDLEVGQVDACVEHGGDKGVPQHRRVHPRQPDTGLVGEGVQPSGGGVPVHLGAARGPQDRTDVPFAGRVVDSSADGWWEGEDDLAAFPRDS